MAWLKTGSSVSRAFKEIQAASLFQKYLERVSKFTTCKSSGFSFGQEKHSTQKRWVCDRGGKPLSSEQLARELESVLHQGIQELEIVIGGPDGFSASEIKALEPDLRWSFGPLTLPHELAAVIGAEQIYRAWAILRKLPYHAGHGLTKR
ncbi:MAG: 23S rRNA (pseudouridine(1915)-N(3))-methyltransferase RlmH [Candidatus Omnitrophica bacterium]|nr:23S rRNA (pseudouridine(1915)-N(3))-methyltransferase RlmH [Candidatus Omnitrophota bacterium]